MQAEEVNRRRRGSDNRTRRGSRSCACAKVHQRTAWDLKVRLAYVAVLGRGILRGPGCFRRDGRVFLFFPVRPRAWSTRCRLLTSQFVEPDQSLADLVQFQPARMMQHVSWVFTCR